MVRVVLSVVLLLVMSIVARGQSDREDESEEASSSIVQPTFRSVQADYVWLYFFDAQALSVDVDFLPFTTTSKIGLRGGVERVYQSGRGGEVAGSPFFAYNLLGRVTFGSGSSRFDVYAGYTWQSSFVDDFQSAGVMKVGGEAKWMIIPHYLGFLVKLNSTIRAFGEGERVTAFGVGLSAGWEP